MNKITIEEAIKILSDSADRGMTTFNKDYRGAQRLGIEALKRIRATRQPGGYEVIIPLPGETE